MHLSILKRAPNIGSVKLYSWTKNVFLWHRNQGATFAGRKFYILRFTEKVCLVPNSSEMVIPRQAQSSAKSAETAHGLFLFSNVRSWPFAHFTFSLCAGGNSNLTAQIVGTMVLIRLAKVAMIGSLAAYAF